MKRRVFCDDCVSWERGVERIRLDQVFHFRKVPTNWGFRMSKNFTLATEMPANVPLRVLSKCRTLRRGFES